MPSVDCPNCRPCKSFCYCRHLCVSKSSFIEYLMAATFRAYRQLPLPTFLLCKSCKCVCGVCVCGVCVCVMCVVCCMCVMCVVYCVCAVCVVCCVCVCVCVSCVGCILCSALRFIVYHLHRNLDDNGLMHVAQAAFVSLPSIHTM